MLKRLRIKFIAINMMMAILVLVTTFGVVCFLNYSNNETAIYSQLNSTLSRVASAVIPQIEGVRPITSQTPESNATDNASDQKTSPNEDNGEGTEQASSAATVDRESFFDPSAQSRSGNTAATSGSNGTASASSQSSAGGSASGISGGAATATANSGVSALVYDEAQLQIAEQDSIIVAPSIGDVASNPAPTILIAVYMINEKGFYTTMSNFSVASVNDRILPRANQAVLDQDDNHGFLPQFDLCFERMPMTDGYIVAYADARSLHDWESLAFMLGGVGIAALLVFFLINLGFSRWALRPVAESMKQQQQFTADASHELKTPLTVILANMSILESQPDSSVAEQMQWVESTQTEAERMQLLVNDMLDLARPKDQKQLSKAPVLDDVDFSDLVEGEVLQFESVAFERGVEMDSRIKADLHVIGDAERLGRMVATLIDNACKYTEDGGKVVVTLTSRSATGKKPAIARLTVHNNGTPIAPEDLPHLFDRFYRADKARTSGKGGYGLGLAIGREIAREHEGDITVSSSSAEGTTFTVILPLA